ncbi:MAG: hypothetical protein Q3993_05190, partial [Filifactor alocis]|nr:hypothetical protein [Filifactor alocis]
MQKLKQNLMKKFPSILRWNQPILLREVYYLVALAVFGLVYFYFHYVLAKLPLSSSIYEASIRVFVLVLSYKLLREISPDMQNHYYFCLMMTGCSLCYPGEVHAFGILFILLTSRVITRSSGRESSDFELGLLSITAFILYLFSSFVYAIHLCIALLIDYFFDNEARKKNIAPAFLMAVLASMWFLRFFGMRQIALSYIWIFIVILSGVLFIYRMSIFHHILSMDDLNQRLLQPGRIKGANANLVVTMLVFAIADGKVSQFAPIWILMLSVSLPYIKDVYLIRKEEKQSEEETGLDLEDEEDVTIQEDTPQKNYPKIILRPELENYNRYLKDKEDIQVSTSDILPPGEKASSVENDDEILKDSIEETGEEVSSFCERTEDTGNVCDEEGDKEGGDKASEDGKDIDEDTHSKEGDDAYDDSEIDEDAYDDEDDDAYDDSEID